MNDIKNFIDLVNEHGIDIDATYVRPGPGLSELRWKVRVLVNGMETLTCDYSAGIAHAPSYPAMVAYDECQMGICLKPGPGRNKPLQPKKEDVIASLCFDARVIDYACFEDWAGEYGYSTDSRKAEKMYHQCLDTALRLRAALGETVLRKLQNHAEAL